MGDIQQNNNQVSFSENSDEQYSNLMGNQEFIAEYPVAPGTVELSIPVKPVHHTEPVPKAKPEPVIEKKVEKPNLPEVAFVEADVDSDGVALTIPPHKVNPHNAELDVSPKYIKPQGLGIDVLNNNFGEDNGDGGIDAADVTVTDFENFTADNTSSSVSDNPITSNVFIEQNSTQKPSLYDENLTSQAVNNENLSSETTDVVQELLSDNTENVSNINVSDSLLKDTPSYFQENSQEAINADIPSEKQDVVNELLADNAEGAFTKDVSEPVIENVSSFLPETSQKAFNEAVPLTESDVVQELLDDNSVLSSSEENSNSLLQDVSSSSENSTQEWEYVEVDSAGDEQEWEYVEVGSEEEEQGWEYVEVDPATQNELPAPDNNVNSQPNSDFLQDGQTATITPTTSQETPNFLHGWSDFGEEAENEALNTAVEENNSFEKNNVHFDGVNSNNLSSSFDNQQAIIEESEQKVTDVLLDDNLVLPSDVAPSSEGEKLSSQFQSSEEAVIPEVHDIPLSDENVFNENSPVSETFTELSVSEENSESEWHPVAQSETYSQSAFEEKESQEVDPVLSSDNEIALPSTSEIDSVLDSTVDIPVATTLDPTTDIPVVAAPLVVSGVTSEENVSDKMVQDSVLVQDNAQKEFFYDTYHFSAQSGIKNFVAKGKNGCICLDCLREELKYWTLLLLQSTCQELSSEQNSLTLPLKQAVLREAKILQSNSQPLVLYNLENYDFQTVDKNFVFAEDKIVSGSYTNKAVFLNDFTVQALSSLETNVIEYSSPQIGVLAGPEGAFLSFAGVLKFDIPVETVVKQTFDDNLKRIAKRYTGHLSDHYANYSAANLEGTFTASEDCKAIHLNLGKSSYGWSVHFDNGLVLGLADVREYQLRNGKLPMNEGTIVYGNKKLKFSGCERIVIYKEAEYFSYR